MQPRRCAGTARVHRQQLAAPHTGTVVCACPPALQEWLPVEALPELVAALDTPLPPAPTARSGRGPAAEWANDAS